MSDTPATQGKATQAERPTAPKAAVELLDRRALNLPNTITLSRLFLALILFVLIWYKGYWITAAVLFVVAAATDFLDGYIARKYGLVTVLGRILDPFVDKIIICGAFVFLLEKKVNLDQGGVAWSGVNAWMVLIVISREMFVTSLRGFMEQQGLDFSASTSGKIKMGLQCVAVTASLLSLSPDVIRLFPQFAVLRDLILWTAVIFTGLSGVFYIQRAARMLRESSRAG